MGFRTVAAWADSEDSGRAWLSFFRKVPPSTATIAGQWFDYSTASGVPVPNYYASAPLVAQRLDPLTGIFVPAQNAARWLKKVVVMSAAASIVRDPSAAICVAFGVEVVVGATIMEQAV